MEVPRKQGQESDPEMVRDLDRDAIQCVVCT